MPFDRTDNQREVHDTNSKRAMAVRTFQSCQASDWSNIEITYPSTTTETYTFKDGVNTISTITLTYTDDTKGFLSSVAKG